jgi:heat shock protein HtpX
MYQQIDSNKRKTVVLMVIFVVFVVLLGFFYGYFTNTGYFGLVIASGLSLIMAATSYFAGDKIALTTAGAKAISKEDNPYVYRMVENLCITAGLPFPKVHIIADSNINAFATGRDPKHASIAITQGAIDKLENEELEGVIAHELSHIKNYDIRVMMIVIVLVGIIALLSDWLLRGFLWNKGDNNKGRLGIILIVAGIVLAVLSPLIAKIIQLAVSRKREFLADADGSLLTRFPQGLANALEKIALTNKSPLQKANNATAHLYIANPFGTTKKFLSGLFSTHPPLEERITKLRQMA